MEHKEKLRPSHAALASSPLSHIVWFFNYWANYCYGHLGRNILELLPWNALERFFSDTRKYYWIVWKKTPLVSERKNPTLKPSFSTFLPTVPTQLTGGPPKGDLPLCSLVSRHNYSGELAAMSLQKQQSMEEWMPRDRALFNGSRQTWFFLSMPQSAHPKFPQTI